MRLCYNEMRHEEGDVLKPRYCILLASGSRKKDLPFVAKISAMWEDPNSGERSKVIRKKGIIMIMNHFFASQVK